MPYQSAAAPAPLLDLLDRVAAPAGWSVRSDGFGAWRGPMLRDDVPFRSAKEAAVRFIRDTADAGWPVGGTIDAPSCVIRVSYHGEVPQVASLALSKGGEVGQEAPLPSLGKKTGEQVDEAVKEIPALAFNAVETRQLYSLEGGLPLKPQLESWAKNAGWSLVWDYPEDWMVPGGTSFGDDFQQAISKVGETLVANGADIKVTIYLGNKTVRLSSKR